MQKDSGRHVQQPSLHRYCPFHSWVDALDGCVQVVPPTHGAASLGLRCRPKLSTKTKRDDRLTFGCKIRQCSNREMFDRGRCHYFGLGFTVPGVGFSCTSSLQVWHLQPKFFRASSGSYSASKSRDLEGVREGKVWASAFESV